MVVGILSVESKSDQILRRECNNCCSTIAVAVQITTVSRPVALIRREAEHVVL